MIFTNGREEVNFLFLLFIMMQKYQDNLEFMQWFKRFYEMAVQDKGDYDTYGQRCRGKGENYKKDSIIIDNNDRSFI